MRRLLLVLVLVAAALGIGYAWRANARADFLLDQRAHATGYAVTLDEARNAMVVRRPTGDVEGHPLAQMMMLSLGTSPAAERVDGRDRMAWSIVPKVGFELPYHTVPPDRMLVWMAPRLLGLDVAHARMLIADYERDPRGTTCVLWVSPRYREVMGPVPPPVGCRPTGDD